MLGAITPIMHLYPGHYITASINQRKRCCNDGSPSYQRPGSSPWRGPERLRLRPSKFSAPPTSLFPMPEAVLALGGLRGVTTLYLVATYPL